MKFLPFVLCIAQSLNMQLAAPPRHCPPPRVPCKEGVQGREWRSNRPPLVSGIPPGQIFLSGASGRKFFGILAFFFFLLKKSRNGVFGPFGWGGGIFFRPGAVPPAETRTSQVQEGYPGLWTAGVPPALISNPAPTLAAVFRRHNPKAER